MIQFILNLVARHAPCIFNRYQHQPSLEDDMFGRKKEKVKEVTLDDVKPLHPDAYPGQSLRSRLDSRREWLREVHTHSPAEAIVDNNLGSAEA